MAVTKVGHGRWHSSLVDKVFDSEEAAEHYDQQQEQVLRGRTQQEQFMDALPSDKVRAYIEREMLAGAYEDIGASAGKRKLIDVWQASHPEIVDSTHNANQIATYLKLTKGNAMPRSTADLDEAAEALNRAGLLQIDQAKLDAKYRREVSAEAEELSNRRQPTEEEMYAMPMHELEERSRGWK